MKFLPLYLLTFVVSFAVARLVTLTTSEELALTPAATSTLTLEQPAALDAISASDRQADVHKTLLKALEGDDPFVSAARVAPWLEGTTAETFRALAADPENFPMPKFSGFDHDFYDAYFEAVAERWLMLDPEGALAGMQRVEEKAQFSYRPGGLLFAAAKLQPALALEKLPLSNEEGYVGWPIGAALGSLAVRDLPAARRFSENATDAKLRTQIDNAIVCGIADADPLGAVEMTTSSDDANVWATIITAAEKIGPGMLRQVLQAAGDRLGPYAITAEIMLRHPDIVAELPNIPSTKSAGNITPDALAAADRLSPEERERLLANYDSLPASLRDGVAAATASAWARTEPEKAAEWALAHGRPEDGVNSANTAAQHVFLRWVNFDTDAALRWWRALPPSSLRDALGTNASTYLAEADQWDAALELFKPAKESSESKSAAAESRPIQWGGGSPEAQAAEHFAQMLTARDPAAAGTWYATLPDSVATFATASAVVDPWYNRDPQAVAHWVEALPAGVARDEAVRVFIRNAAQQSPAGAAEWVATIGDPGLRQSAAGIVYFEMRNDDPAGARRWLGELQNVDPEWQARMLRR